MGIRGVVLVLEVVVAEEEGVRWIVLLCDLHELGGVLSVVLDF